MTTKEEREEREILAARFARGAHRELYDAAIRGCGERLARAATKSGVAAAEERMEHLVQARKSLEG